MASVSSAGQSVESRPDGGRRLRQTGPTTGLWYLAGGEPGAVRQVSLVEWVDYRDYDLPKE